MNQKDARILRQEITEQISENITKEGFDFVGFTSEGAAFSNEEDAFVVRTIVKAEGTDILALVNEFEAKQKEKEEKVKSKD